MKVRVVIKRVTDPVDGDPLERIIEVPDGTGLDSQIELTTTILAIVEDVDESDPGNPVFTVYIDDADFDALKSQWHAAAA